MGIEPEGVQDAAARLRAQFERLQSPLLIVDDDRRCVAANASACALLELTPAQISGHRLDDFISPAGRDRLDTEWARLGATGGLEGRIQLEWPGAAPVPIEFSVTANVLPGRHLSVVMPRSGDPAEPADPAPESAVWARLAPVGAEQAALTPREHEVLLLVATGLQGGEIAERLVVSPETVKSHVQNVMAKLGAHTRAHAVAIALRTGQIEI